MAKRVVDMLETVEVEIKQRHFGCFVTGREQSAPEPVLEQRPVGKAGERVVEGEILRLGLTGLQRRRCTAEAAQQECQDTCREQRATDQGRPCLAHKRAAGPLLIPAGIGQDDAA